MKAKVKIIKLGSSFFGIQVPIGNNVVWGKFQGDSSLTAEQQQNYAKALLTANPDGEVEIDYITTEGKKGIKITSIKEIKDGKAVEATKEQTKTVKSEDKKTKDVGNPEARKDSSKSNYKPDDTQNSIEHQVAAKAAAQAIQVIAGQIDPKKDVTMFLDIYGQLFDRALAKIQKR